MLELFRFPFSAMGSPCEAQLYAPDAARATRCAGEAIAEVHRLDAKYSTYRGDSFIAEINRAAATGGAIDVDNETATLVDYAATCFEQSEGLFDVTSGVLSGAWDRRRTSLPAPGELRALLARVGFDKIHWHRPTLRFGVPGMALDFGGIVKEYAADRAASICAAAGILQGLVDLGGDIRLIGPHPDGAPWVVGVRHPRRAGELLASIELHRGAIASSGDYERFIEIDGRRYGHIISPRTGLPAGALVAVSVVAEECVVAGSATTIAMVMEEDGPAWLAEVGLPHVFMDREMRVGGTLARAAPGAQARDGGNGGADNRLIWLKAVPGTGWHDALMTTSPSPAELVGLAFDADLVRKYDGFGPRYTSYPTADRFTDAFGASELVAALTARRDAPGVPQPLSLYVHVPFCNTICYYCACNKVITKDHGRSAKYIRYVGREIGIVAGLVDSASPVKQLHWGGGTPTFLSAEEMTELTRLLRENFRFDPDAECSIEIDPRKVTAETVKLLATLGFNRMSLGVQDFDPAVQQAVNRIQSEEETRAVLDAARGNGFRSINVDLIYGLPKQGVASFGATLDKIVAMAPDRVALYNYAHVPHLFKPQRRILEIDLPHPEVKLAILEQAIDRLTSAGYVYIGMDHFARPDDELAVAQRQGSLQRNFQGYSTHRDCDLLAFGISAIGKVGTTYSQNVRTLDEYYERLDQGILPCFRGYELCVDDRLRRDVIAALMCGGSVDFRAVDVKHGIAFRDYFAPELEALEPLAADGLVEIGDWSIAITPRGRLLMRNVAMVFDRHLREQRERARYSRVI